MKLFCLGDCTDISFIDSTPLKVCHYKREKQHQVFKGSYGTMGWYFGFKLHLVCNDKGEIVDFMFTPANVDDRFPLKQKKFHDKIFGNVFGDKGYIGKDLFDRLFVDGTHLITKVRKSMKKKAMDFMDKVIHRKGAIIETVNDVLKNTCQIEHSRHRSFDNFITNMVSRLIAYSFLPKNHLLKYLRCYPIKLLLRSNSRYLLCLIKGETPIVNEERIYLINRFICLFGKQVIESVVIRL